MKTPARHSFALPLAAALAFMGFAATPARAHDSEQHRYYDYVRADELNRHADDDRYHAAQALDRAFATGDPRDFLHALRDRQHAKEVARDARDAQDHARYRSHCHGD